MLPVKVPLVESASLCRFPIRELALRDAEWARWDSRKRFIVKLPPILVHDIDNRIPASPIRYENCEGLLYGVKVHFMSLYSRYFVYQSFKPSHQLDL
jgi:hypothetical protein